MIGNGLIINHDRKWLNYKSKNHHAGIERPDIVREKEP